MPTIETDFSGAEPITTQRRNSRRRNRTLRRPTYMGDGAPAYSPPIPTAPPEEPPKY